MICQNGNKVGFIGLGNTGRGMAKNLIDKGHQVVAFDTDPESLKTAVSQGAQEAKSPKVLNDAQWPAGHLNYLVT